MHWYDRLAVATSTGALRVAGKVEAAWWRLRGKK
jgi:hypothetical protein